jgi:hypothetical protein
MTAIRPRQMMSFVEELQKIAAFPGAETFKSIGRFFDPRQLPGRYGRQVWYGAGLGAAGNIARHAITDTPEQRAQGSALSQGLHGAMAGAGLAGGRILATQEGRKRAGEAVRNFGKKELYGLTGKGVKDLAEAERVGIYPRMPDIGDVVGRQPLKPGQLAHEAAPLRAGTEVEEAALKKMRAQAQAGRDLHTRGWDSAPGGLHALVTEPGEFVKKKWQSMDTPGKFLTGLGAAGVGYSAIKGPSEAERAEGQGRISKTLSSAGMAAGGLVAPWTWVAGMAVPGAMSSAGKGIGSAADAGVNLLRHRAGHVVPAEEQAQWQTQG